MDRVTRFNVLAMSGRAVEAAGDVDTLLLDKTGTITYGNRLASAFIPVGKHRAEELVAAAYQASVADETPEGKSIVVLARQRGYSGVAARASDNDAAAGGAVATLAPDAELVPFSAETRMSGI